MTGWLDWVVTSKPSGILMSSSARRSAHTVFVRVQTGGHRLRLSDRGQTVDRDGRAPVLPVAFLVFASAELVAHPPPAMVVDCTRHIRFSPYRYPAPDTKLIYLRITKASRLPTSAKYIAFDIQESYNILYVPHHVFNTGFGRVVRATSN